MWKNNIRKGILRSLCAAVTAFAAAAVPVMGGTTFADTKDYDQEIAQLEQKAEQIKRLQGSSGGLFSYSNAVTPSYTYNIGAMFSTYA